MFTLAPSLQNPAIFEILMFWTSRYLIIAPVTAGASQFINVVKVTVNIASSV